MQNTKNDGKSINLILAAAFLVVSAVFLALFFDYYYDLNDDMLMKDIVSGIFTGRPDGHNIQMLFPLSWLLSLFYFVARKVTWYGLFFVLCHFGCFYLLAARSLTYFDKVRSKLTALFFGGVFICAFLLYEIVFIQYTVTAALLGATTAFLLYTTEDGLSCREFYKKNIGSIAFVILAFQIRKEMLLLIFPLLCVVGVCKWSEEKEIFSRESFQKYLFVMGTILAGMVLSIGINSLAYGSGEWKEFDSFFDSRTDIYDFYGIPPFEENKEFYDRIGISEKEQNLLINYNFGLSEEIHTGSMEQIADYAKKIKGDAKPFGEQLGKSLVSYRYMLLSEKMQLPWNHLVLLLYALIMAAAICNRKGSFLWKIPLLFGVRSGLWLFLLYRERIMPRVSNSLYLAEVLILTAWLLVLYDQSRKQEKKSVKIGMLLMAAVLFLFLGKEIPQNISRVIQEGSRREEVNLPYLELQEYCRERKENFYFLDIYSTVKYSEKVFAPADHELKNYNFLGGWVCKSPLDRQKQAAYELGTIEDAVLNEEKVFVISETDRPIAWLQEYFAEKEKSVTVEQTDAITVDGTEVFAVYRVNSGGK